MRAAATKECDTETLRAGLRALGVPEPLLTVRWVENTADCFDDTVEGEPLDEADQTSGLLALLHRLAANLRAQHALDFYGAVNEMPEDQQNEGRSAESRMIAIDDASAWSADDTMLVRFDPRSATGRGLNRSRQVGQAAEEARWLWQTLVSIANAAHADARAAHDEGTCIDKVPAALYCARTLAKVVWSLTTIAHIEMADPDLIDSNEAALLGESLVAIRQATGVMLRYGTHRGLLHKITGPDGRPAYEVVTDIVAAAATAPAGGGGESE